MYDSRDWIGYKTECPECGTKQNLTPGIPICGKCYDWGGGPEVTMTVIEAPGGKQEIDYLNHSYQAAR